MLPHLCKELAAKGVPWLVPNQQQQPEGTSTGAEHRFCSPYPFHGSLRPTAGRQGEEKISEVAHNSKKEQLSHLRPFLPSLHSPRTQEAC